MWPSGTCGSHGLIRISVPCPSIPETRDWLAYRTVGTAKPKTKTTEVSLFVQICLRPLLKFCCRKVADFKVWQSTKCYSCTIKMLMAIQWFWAGKIPTYN